MNWTFERIQKLVGDNQVLSMVPAEKIAFIHDYDGHTLHVFEQIDTVLWEEMDVNFSEMAKKLAAGMSKEGFLEDFLRTLPVETLLKVKNRLDKPNSTVKDKDGCYKLIISGGPGRGLGLYLRE